MAVFHLSLAAPRTVGARHSIRSGLGPVFWFHSGRRHRQAAAPFTWPSVSACSESSSGGSTPRAQQGSPATRSPRGFLGSYLKRPFVRQHWACFKTRGEGCKASSHSSGSGGWKQSPDESSRRWNTVNDRQSTVSVWQGGFCACWNPHEAGRTSPEISSAPYQNIVARDGNLWYPTRFSHQILITRHYTTPKRSSCCNASGSHRFTRNAFHSVW